MIRWGHAQGEDKKNLANTLTSLIGNKVIPKSFYTDTCEKKLALIDRAPPPPESPFLCLQPGLQFVPPRRRVWYPAAGAGGGRMFGGCIVERDEAMVLALSEDWPPEDDPIWLLILWNVRDVFDPEGLEVMAKSAAGPVPWSRYWGCRKNFELPKTHPRLWEFSDLQDPETRDFLQRMRKHRELTFGDFEKKEWNAGFKRQLHSCSQWEEHGIDMGRAVIADRVQHARRTRAAADKPVVKKEEAGPALGPATQTIPGKVQVDPALGSMAVEEDGPGGGVKASSVMQEVPADGAPAEVVDVAGGAELGGPEVVPDVVMLDRSQEMVRTPPASPEDAS